MFNITNSVHENSTVEISQNIKTIPLNLMANKNSLERSFTNQSNEIEYKVLIAYTRPIDL